MNRRWSEKATFYILMAMISICFILSIFFIMVLYYQTLIFWATASTCYTTNDFNCLANALTDRSVINQRLIASLAGVASINGIISSLTFLIIYKIKG